MSLSKIKKYGALLLKPKNLFSNKKYILIISHMRSRSTLLSHILGSNSNICGYRELHLPYTNRFSLIKMRAALQGDDNFGSSGYLLDKLLHNNLHIDTSIFDGKLKLLILLREPYGTVRSMFNMHKGLYGTNNYLHLIDYYAARLGYMAEFARANKEKFLFVESESLINDAERTLENISRYLGLTNQLSATYKQFTETGMAGSGDPGKNIMAGKIIKTTDASEKYNLTDADQNKLKTIYALCETTLKELSIR